MSPFTARSLYRNGRAFSTAAHPESFAPYVADQDRGMGKAGFSHASSYLKAGPRLEQAIQMP